MSTRTPDQLADWRRRNRERGLDPDDPRHGTRNGYANYGCRCDECTDANSASKGCGPLA